MVCAPCAACEGQRAGQFEDALMTDAVRLEIIGCMLDVTTLKAQDLAGLSQDAVTEIAGALLAQLAAHQAEITARDEHIARRDREIKFRDAKIERITFELARLKAWKSARRPRR
jgi:transposase